jgi:hypothetical protein
MGSYHIWMRRDVADEGEVSVMVQDETDRSLGELRAFSTMHARKVARDLMSLVRRGDPDGAFTLDPQIRELTVE